MNIVISIIVCILLFIYINYVYEDFSQTTSSNSQTTSASANPEVKYFELNNEAKNLVNSYKYETQLREIAKEEDDMKNNVRKIVDHAENVLDFIELNEDYLEREALKAKNID